MLMFSNCVKHNTVVYDLLFFKELAAVMMSSIWADLERSLIGIDCLQNRETKGRGCLC